MLRMLEQRFGREKFDEVIRQWFDGHAFQSVGTDEFLAFFGKRLFLAVMGANKIVEIDPATRRLVGEIQTDPGPARLALTPDEKTLVYNNQLGKPGVAFADVATRRQVARADLPGRPLSLTLSPDGRTAYLGVQEEDQIAVVSVAERKVTRYIRTRKGAGPDPVLTLP